MRGMSYLTFCLISLSAFDYGNSLHYRMGGYQLLMTSETHKQATRIVGYLDNDLQELNSLLDALPYASVNGKKILKNELDLPADVKKKIEALTVRMTENFDQLTEVFKSIYFISQPGIYNNQEFDAIKAFQKEVKLFSKSKEVASLASIHDQGRDAGNNLNQISSFIEQASIKSEAYIKDKQRTMSVWQWLFGY